MSYVVKFKRKWFWRSFTVVGHQWITQADKLVLYFSDGSIREIPEWSKCEARLGVDWVLATKKQMETESGVDIKTRV